MFQLVQERQKLHAMQFHLRLTEHSVRWKPLHHSFIMFYDYTIPIYEPKISQVIIILIYFIMLFNNISLGAVHVFYSLLPVKHLLSCSLFLPYEVCGYVLCASLSESNSRLVESAGTACTPVWGARWKCWVGHRCHRAPWILAHSHPPPTDR